MKYLFILLSLVSILYCCSTNETTNKKKDTKKEIENLVDIKDGIFTEYYPGKKQIKFQGPQDENGARDGKWTFFSEEGIELGISNYTHGKKDGVSIVKYPNGVLHYYGEYTNDEMTGVWKTYDQQGKLVEEKDYSKK
jgi:antitoxin component YwqK of YwqJK toxin-antitoxin module